MLLFLINLFICFTAGRAQQPKRQLLLYRAVRLKERKKVFGNK